MWQCVKDEVHPSCFLRRYGGRGYIAISNQLGVHHSTVRTITHEWKTLKFVLDLSRRQHPEKSSLYGQNTPKSYRRKPLLSKK